MITLRPSQERGHNKIDWLNSYHTFSFADYYDSNWIRRGFIRVINEDYIQPGQGFGMHPHQDMEIITYVIRGALKHQDSMGHVSIIKPGEIQRMSAGSGVLHSEFNHSEKEELHLLQIWILPETKGIEPGYEQKQIPQIRNQLLLIGSKYPSHQVIKIHQNIELYAGYYDQDQSLAFSLNHHAIWIQLIQGQLNVNEHELFSGDGIWIQQEDSLQLKCIQQADFLLFKMD